MTPHSVAARLLTLTLLAAGLAVGLTGTTAAPAAAAGRTTVTNDRGTAAADSRYRTPLTVRGNGFQVVKGGFGGVYVMFGWVKDPSGGSWKPSRGGVVGKDYRYIPDAENAANNQGYLRFIAFPGSSTAGEANGTLAANGSFRTTMTVPGPTFQSVDRNGKVATVDCTKVTCGIITIGAHGVKNRANESFTPVRFTNVYDSAPTGGTGTADNGATAGGTGTGDTATNGGSTGGSTGETGTANPAKTPTGTGKVTPKLTTDRLTAKVGNTLAFTATGFRPGEQVLGVLDDGVAGIGPMVAGPSGEVAGILPLPRTLTSGTHELRLTGAASGGTTTERFAVRPADDATAPAAATTDDADDDGLGAGRIFLLVAVGVFALALLGLALRLLLRRRGRSAVTA
ncbi:hypothetical protein [Pimelobacter simplex]|uniref:hypothetical protein n=1 Tax=Nocardioides simplex TaxID=2045 RepID=UPI003AAF8B43